MRLQLRVYQSIDIKSNSLYQLGYCLSGAICSAKTNFKKAAYSFDIKALILATTRFVSLCAVFNATKLFSPGISLPSMSPLAVCK